MISYILNITFFYVLVGYIKKKKNGKLFYFYNETLYKSESFKNLKNDNKFKNLIKIVLIFYLKKREREEKVKLYSYIYLLNPSRV